MILLPSKPEGLLRPGELLDDFMAGVVQFDLSCIHAFAAGHVPRLLHDGLRGLVAEENRALYADGIYLLDPTFQHMQAGHPGGFLGSQDLTAARTVPGGLLSVGAFHPLLSLERDGIGGHVAFLLRMDDHAVAYSLLRKSGSPGFSLSEERHLREQEKYVLHLLGRYEIADFRKDAAVGGGAAMSLDAIMHGELPPRQCAVLCLSMQGYSLEDIGVELGISPNTARAHLQSAYRRLGVRNRGEVFAIVLDRIGVNLGSSRSRRSEPPAKARSTRRGQRQATL